MSLAEYIIIGLLTISTIVNILNLREVSIMFRRQDIKNEKNKKN